VVPGVVPGVVLHVVQGEDAVLNMREEKPLDVVENKDRLPLTVYGACSHTMVYNSMVCNHNHSFLLEEVGLDTCL
jgi:hypothetical protein